MSLMQLNLSDTERMESSALPGNIGTSVGFSEETRFPA